LKDALAHAKPGTVTKSIATLYKKVKSREKYKTFYEMITQSSAFSKRGNCTMMRKIANVLFDKKTGG